MPIVDARRLQPRPQRPVVPEMHDLTVTDSEHDDVGKREVATGRGCRTGYVLLDDDDLGIGGLMDHDVAVRLVMQRVRLPVRLHEGTDLLRSCRRDGTPGRVKGTPGWRPRHTGPPCW